MFWTILLGYIIFSQIVVVLWVGISNYLCNGSVLSGCNVSESAGTDGRPSWANALAFLMLLVTAPLTLICMVWWVVSCCFLARKEFQELNGKHRPLLLDPLHEGNIPVELENYLDEQTPAAADCQFELLGDYWLKGEPINSKARLFIANDHTAFAEIGIILEALYCEAISFLTDGTIIATANGEPFSKMDAFARHGCHIQMLPQAGIYDVIQAHREFAVQIAETTGLEIQPIDRDDWKLFYRYHNQRFSQIKFELGELSDPPAVELTFPIQSTVASLSL